MWGENWTCVGWFYLGCLGMWALWSKLHLWLSCQKRASVEWDLLLLCWLWIPWCMAPLICVCLVFLINLPSPNITKKPVDVESCLRPSACQFSAVIKRGSRSCPRVCGPWLYFQRVWKLAVPFKGNMLLKELMLPWCVDFCLWNLCGFFYKPCWQNFVISCFCMSFYQTWWCSVVLEERKLSWEVTFTVPCLLADKVLNKTRQLWPFLRREGILVGRYVVFWFFWPLQF